MEGGEATDFKNEATKSTERTKKTSAISRLDRRWRRAFGPDGGGGRDPKTQAAPDAHQLVFLDLVRPLAREARPAADLTRATESLFSGLFVCSVASF